MQLHVLPGSPNCHKVLATAHHLDLDVEIVEKQLFSDELKSDDFLAINPNGKTPALVDGVLNLWESNAICVYLAANHRRSQDLFPTAHRPQINQWLFWETKHYNNALGTIAWQTVIKPGLLKQDADEHSVRTATEDFHHYARVLDDHLNGGIHIAGDDWTIADYALGVLEKFTEFVPLDFNQYPNIVRYYQALRENPHWSATRMSLDSLLNAA